MNVLNILADDLGREQVGLYPGIATPSDIPSMPNLDALAASGVRLNRFYATGLCSPTRAVYLTGRYTFRQGMGNIVQGENAIPLQPSEPAIPKLLRAVGVKTALIGKYHLGNSKNGGNRSPYLAAGYDYHSGSIRNILPGQGQTYYNWPHVVNGEDRGLNNEYYTARCTNDALRWINRQGSSPWFMHIAYQCPHEPWNGPPLGTYDDARWGVVSPAGPPNETPSVVRPFFKAMVENLDYEIGRLLAGIPPEVLAETQIQFWGDNGTPGPVLPAETHPTKGPYSSLLGKQSTYEPGVRLPCIISGAGVVNGGRTSDALIHAVDFWRTTMRFYGLSDAKIERLLPPGRVMDSLDFTGILSDTASTHRDSVLTELFGVNEPNPATISGIRANIGQRYKLRIGGSLPSPTYEFYDLDWLDANNLFETAPSANLIPGGSLTGLSDSDPNHPGERTAYFTLLNDFLARVATYDEDSIL